MLKTPTFAFVLIALSGSASADDNQVSDTETVRLVCAAGRLGMPLAEVIHIDDPKLVPDRFKNIWEGCRQESVKDLSCYPFTFTKDGKSRVIYMPGSQPGDARFEPLTADCKGRVGRWPAWQEAKEDQAETYRMGMFYAKNPPGELP